MRTKVNHASEMSIKTCTIESEAQTHNYGLLKALLKKNVLRCPQKVLTLLQDRSSDGSELKTAGAADLNARVPMANFERGTISRLLPPERSEREGV